VVPPTGPIPLSRGAAERALLRVDHYPRHAELTGIHRLTSTGTVFLDFIVVDDQPFVFQPGYFVGIQAEVDGIGVRRSPYCIASPPNDERRFRLLVREVTEAPMSYYLTGLAVGDVINLPKTATPTSINDATAKPSACSSAIVRLTPATVTLPFSIR